MNAHMHDKLKIVLLATCPCGEGDQTTEERSATGPTETTLHQKLHGDVEDLRRTTKFIIVTGLTV